ncbi:unnamed protein product [Leptosia nina]|uniref:N(6)-L-threonylcarbamoyladenine synthase n=1 Tax=Leptosia nina TaxID=320188 RepID=A0AAV1JWF0_9NEOP
MQFVFCYNSKLISNYGRYIRLRKFHSKPLIFGIETSCDDTGCAIVDGRGNLLSESLHCQNLIHLRNGGIIPDVAQDLHRRYIELTVEDTLKKANLSMDDITALAVTLQPGLPLSLAVGMKYAKHLARKFNKPFIPIHHMEAHALVSRMQHNIPFPYLTLLISGGHCLLAIVQDINQFKLLGESLDSAPGEVFDKVSRRLKLRNVPEYSKMSGGQAIEASASKASDPHCFKLPLPLANYKDCNFSFNGLKTSTLLHLHRKEKEHNIEGDELIPEVSDLCAALLMAVTRHLVHRTQRAIEFCKQRKLIPETEGRLVVSGGVACNNFIFKNLTILCNEMEYDIFRPDPKLCTDNGVMIAWNGLEKWRGGVDIVTDLNSLDIKAVSPLGDYNADTLDKNACLNWRRYGGLVRESPIINLVHLYEPELFETIFRQNDRYPARRSHIAMLHYRLGMDQIGGAYEVRFKETFQGLKMQKKYVAVTDRVVTQFLQWLKDKEMSTITDFLPYLNRLNLEVIGAVVFDESFNSFSDPEQLVSSRSNKIISAAFGSNSGIMKLDKGVMWKLFTTPLYRKLAKSQEYLEKVSKDILLKKLNYYAINSESNDSSLLSSFMQLPGVDVKDIVGMMVDILMAGIDTTSYTTSFALYHIATNPDCQKELFREALSLLPDEKTEISASVLAKAVYLKSCVKESLRLNPVAIGVGRVLQNDVILKGYKIPSGTVVVTQNMVASRLPQYVRNPSRFIPERYLRGSTQYEDIHPFLSLPFGFGPRSCIARRLAEQNMCITIMKIVRNYKIEWLGGKLGVKTLLINKPDQPISLKLTPRSGI